MIGSRLALYPLIGLCAVLAACSGKADKLSDAEIARMLHTEGLADERVDAAAVDCLRAWADDSSLSAGLKAELTAEPGKSDCRRHMQGWLDDGSRNPQGLMFVDVATPKLTKRAMDLLAALPPLESAPTAVATTTTDATASAPMGDVLPPAATPADVPPATAEAAFEERVKISNSTNETLVQYEAACQDALNLAKTRQFSEAATRRISRCKATAARLRTRVDEVVARGTAFDVSMATRGADQELQILRTMMADKSGN